jgi:hypothetical protein
MKIYNEKISQEFYVKTTIYIFYLTKILIWKFIGIWNQVNYTLVKDEA